jgi:hypothetical protein
MAMAWFPELAAPIRGNKLGETNRKKQKAQIAGIAKSIRAFRRI